jgi:hypothetical protein
MGPTRTWRGHCAALTATYSPPRLWFLAMFGEDQRLVLLHFWGERLQKQHLNSMRMDHVFTR